MIDPLVRQRLRQIVSRRGRLPRAPAWLYPRLIESRHSQVIMVLTEGLRTETARILAEGLASAVSAANPALRADGPVEQIVALVRGVRRQFPAMSQKIGLVSRHTASRVAEWNGAQWARSMKQVLGVELFQHEPWMSDVVSAFVQQNVSLIGGVHEELASAIESRLVNGVMQGRTTEQIAQSILRTGELDPGPFRRAITRARFIARDQIGKLNGQLSRLRQTSLGINHYIWATALDERVRPAHAQREGRRFSWDHPPEGGHPGEDYNCRCTAEPDFNDVLEDLVA